MSHTSLMGLSLTAVAALTATLVATTADGAPAAPATKRDDVPVGASTVALRITGHGYGHGHGLSQYGAKGAAAQGLGWEQIVGFYYPGTQVDKARGPVRVLLTAATKRGVSVEAQDRLRLDRVGGEKSYRLDRLRPGATRWKLMPRGSRSVLSYQARSGGWKRLTSFPGTGEFSGGNRPVTLRLPGGATADYRGALRLVDGTTVNVLPLERYLRGVVAREVPATWPAAAVQSQAVAARTYAAYERADASGSYDLCDTTACQVYGGVAAEHPDTNAAIRATRNRVVTYAGAPAFTQFSSSNGGHSAAGSMPYLVAQPDPYEASSANPYATWTTTLARSEVEEQWPQVGQLTRLTLTRDAQGNRVATVLLSGSGGSVTVAGDGFRSALGLRSEWFAVSTASRNRVTRAGSLR